MAKKREKKARTLTEKELTAAVGGMRRRLKSQVSQAKGATMVYADDGINIETNDPAANNVEVIRH